MVSTILVPLDGSPLAEQALPYAERLGLANSARFVLSRVQAINAPDGANIDSAAADAARAYLRGIADSLTRKESLVETTTPSGAPAAEILKQARSVHADLIVMATHGHSGLGRWLYGSVADEVLRHAAVPVVVVPPDSAAPWPSERGPHILVPLDGSEFAEAAVGPAQTLATQLGSDIILLQVIPFPPYGLEPGATAAYLELFDPDAQISEAKHELAQVAQRLRPTVSEVRVRVELGKPASLIQRVATAENADIIVMATHGRSGLARTVLGSVATETLQRSDIPLMFVRPSGLKAVAAPVASQAKPGAAPVPTG